MSLSSGLFCKIFLPSLFPCVAAPFATPLLPPGLHPVPPPLCFLNQTRPLSIVCHLPLNCHTCYVFFLFPLLVFLLCGTQPHRWNMESGVRASTVLNILSEAEAVVSSSTECVYLLVTAIFVG